MQKNKLYKEIESAITSAHDEGITLDQAEKLAFKALAAQVEISDNLTSVELDARMAKSGLKAIKAAVYMNTVSAADRKPTEAAITAIIDSDETVAKAQDALDKYEVRKEELYRQFGICEETHILARGISKGKFE